MICFVANSASNDESNGIVALMFLSVNIQLIMDNLAYRNVFICTKVYSYYSPIDTLHRW